MRMIFLFCLINQNIFFFEYMNKKHKNMKFSIETEVNGSLAFLDVKIFCENDKFVTSVFRKETFSGVDTNFINFIPLEYMFGLVHTLKKFCRKMHIRKSLLINAFKNSLIICLFKGYKFLVYRKKNLE